MKESIAATNSTYTTSIAMILILVLVVEKITLQTGVLPKLTVAILAGGLDRLASVAQNTYQLCHLLPVHCMCFLLVVTKPASVHLIAARSHKLGLSFIVLAAIVVIRSGWSFLPRGRRMIHDGLYEVTPVISSRILRVAAGILRVAIRSGMRPLVVALHPDVTDCRSPSFDGLARPACLPAC